MQLLQEYENMTLFADVDGFFCAFEKKEKVKRF